MGIIDFRNIIRVAIIDDGRILSVDELNYPLFPDWLMLDFPHPMALLLMLSYWSCSRYHRKYMTSFPFVAELFFTKIF
jgi:hypothetical protein